MLMYFAMVRTGIFRLRLSGFSLSSPASSLEYGTRPDLKQQLVACFRDVGVGMLLARISRRRQRSSGRKSGGRLRSLTAFAP